MDQISPEKLKTYRILEALQSGPNGDSYKAFDPNGESEVVLKLVSAEMSERLSFKGPGLTLVRNVSSLAAEAVCKVSEISAVEQRTLIVRPFVEGNSLRSIIERGPEEKDLFILNAQRIVVALLQIHREKMLHGNLRDSNVIFDTNESIQFVDYGLLTGFNVDDLEPEEEAAEWLQFLPPEIIRGTEMGRHSDLYALGVIFFRMVTGILPFGEGSNRQIIDRIRAGVNSRDALREAELGGDCILLIEKLLAPSPDDRFSSASELLITLDEISQQANRPETQSPPRPDDSPPRVYILVSAAVVIVAILWILLTGYPR